ncbi:MAG: FkbM family methyltransferase [Actinomycetota bacterium]|nr:FkbM family methyltransferase [Actinomycetota bacterium]
MPIPNFLNSIAFKTVLRDPRVLLVRSVEGFRIVVPLDDQAAAPIVLERRYDSELSRIIGRFLDETDGLIDIGANLGYFSLLAAWRYPQKPVLAIEPNPYLCTLITASIQANGFENVRLRATAAGAAAGYGRLELDPRRSSNAVVHEDGDRGGAELIPITTVDAIFAGLPTAVRPLLKVDVEGMEVDVLRGSSAAFGRRCPMICEVFGSSAGRLEPMLIEYGYQALTLDGTAVTTDTLARRRRSDVVLVPRETTNALQDLLLTSRPT